MQKSGFTVATTDCGVTPQAQNTGSSSAVHLQRVAVVRLHDVLDADHLGKPTWTGAPCTAGNRVVIWMARIASAGFSGRIDTTSGPWNGPAGAVAIEVRYIGTVRALVMWRNSMPSCISASSNENEQPSAKITRSSRQWP